MSGILPATSWRAGGESVSGGLTTVLFAVVVVAALYFGRDVLVPVALAMLLSFVLAPLVRLLQRWYIPRTLAVITVVLIAFAAILGAGTLVVSQVNQLASDLPQYQSTLREKIQALRGVAAGTGTLVVWKEVAAEMPTTAAPPGFGGTRPRQKRHCAIGVKGLEAIVRSRDGERPRESSLRVLRHGDDGQRSPAPGRIVVPVPKLAKSETLPDAVNRLRQQAASLRAKLAEIERAPLPSTYARARLKEQLAAIPARGEINIDRLLQREEGEIGFPTTQFMMKVHNSEPAAVAIGRGTGCHRRAGLCQP